MFRILIMLAPILTQAALFDLCPTVGEEWGLITGKMDTLTFSVDVDSTLVNFTLPPAYGGGGASPCTTAANNGGNLSVQVRVMQHAVDVSWQNVTAVTVFNATEVQGEFGSDVELNVHLCAGTYYTLVFNYSSFGADACNAVSTCNDRVPVTVDGITVSFVATVWDDDSNSNYATEDNGPFPSLVLVPATSAPVCPPSPKAAVKYARNARKMPYNYGVIMSKRGPNKKVVYKRWNAVVTP